MQEHVLYPPAQRCTLYVFLYKGQIILTIYSLVIHSEMAIVFLFNISFYFTSPLRVITSRRQGTDKNSIPLVLP